MRVVQMSPFSAPPSSPKRESAPSAFVKPSANFFDFKTFKKDDWILLGIICTLVLEGSEDYILLCVLGYLFLVGI